MALKLPDSAVPMGDFPVAKAVDIDFDDGENLQEKLDNGALGGGGNTTDLTDLENRLSKLETKRVYNSLEELNTAKGLSISLTSGEDNTMKIVDALSPIETFADYFSNGINNNRFGIDTNTYGFDISLLVITKFNDYNAIIRAYMSNGKLLVRGYINGVLQDWACDSTRINTKINELFQSVSDGKTLVANAITDKGVSTATDATFATMATNISKINTNGYKEETASWNKTSTGTNRIVFTFSADIYGVKQITPPSDASSNIVPETSTSMFTINGRKLTLYVNGVGTWEVTAIVRNA